MDTGFSINAKKFNLWVIGTGGIGGNLIPDLTQMLGALKDVLDIKLTLIDGDVVSKRNLRNQPFILSDIGKKKVTVLAQRYQCRGIPIHFIPSYIDSSDGLQAIIEDASSADCLNIIIGAVDNDESRCMIYDCFSKADSAIWIDAGHEFYSGRVVMGMRYNGFSVLPSAVELFPNILDKETKLYHGEGCSHSDYPVVQGIELFDANLTAAKILLSFIKNLLLSAIDKDFKICTHGVTFNTHSIYSKPMYIERTKG